MFKSLCNCRFYTQVTSNTGLADLVATITLNGGAY